MNLKNINKFIILYLLFFNFSCSELEILNKKNSDYNIVNNYELETDQIIINSNKFSNINFNDFYSKNKNFTWKKLKPLEKNFTLNLGKFNKTGSYVSNFLVQDNSVYFMDKNVFREMSLIDGKEINNINLDIDIDLDLIFPIFIAKNDNYFFASFSSGSLIKFDNLGEILWSLKFDDIIKTPIKIYNDKIIIIFNSNKIFSINSDDGTTLWQYEYELNKSSSSMGGDILFKNNILFVILPNGRVGTIDTILGEKIYLKYINSILQKNILSNNYDIKLHIYDHILSVIENYHSIYSYHLEENKYLLFNEKITGNDSIKFKNNVLLMVDNKKSLKAINILNKKLFWNIDLSDYISKNEIITDFYIFNNSLIVFFSKGNILQINKFNGNIEFHQNLKLKQISYMSSYNNNLVFVLDNGKAIFYRQ